MALFAASPWSTDLNSLAGGLFPDPSKQAQAGLIGAEQGKAEAQGQRLHRENRDTWNLPLPPLVGVQQAPSPLAATMAGAQTAPVSPGVSQGATVVGTAPPTRSLGAVVSGQPGTGTDGKPMPPDETASPIHPGTIQQPGGGVKQAPPAQSNGRPAPVMDVKSYVDQLATYVDGVTRTYHSDAQKTAMAGNAINVAVAKGVIDARTGNEMMARYGLTAPYVSDQTLQQGRERNATDLANTRLQGANSLATVHATAAEQRATTDAGVEQGVDDQGNAIFVRKGPAADRGGRAYDAGLASARQQGANSVNLARVTAAEQRTTADAGVEQGVDDQGHPIFVRKGPAADRGGRAYDPARALAGDKPGEVNTRDGPRIVPTRDMPGNAPVSEADLIWVVPTRGKAVPEQMSRAMLRQRMSEYRMASPDDLKHVTVNRTGSALPEIVTGAETLNNPGVSPTPGSVDAANAQRLSAATGAQITGNTSLGDTIFEALRAGNMAGTIKQAIKPEDQFTMDEEGDKYLNTLYPKPSGWNAASTEYPITVDSDTRAYHSALVRQLQNGEYRNNPAAAVKLAWDMMREQGRIPKDASGVRNLGMRSGAFTEPRITGDHQLVLPSNLPRDKDGNVIFPGGGPVARRPAPTATAAPPAATPPASALATTVAPSPGGGALPPGAIAAAPGVADGRTLTGPGGQKGVVRGGFLYQLGTGP